MKKWSTGRSGFSLTISSFDSSLEIFFFAGSNQIFGMNFSKIKQALRDNVSVVSFLAVIAFFILSFWSTHQSQVEAAQALVTYTQSSLAKLNTKMSEVASTTLILENKPESYDKTSQTLQDFDSFIDQLRNSMPRRGTDEQSIQLQRGLDDFYTTIKINTKNIQQRYMAQKDLIGVYQTYGQMKNIAQNGTKAELNEAYQAGLKINKFNKEVKTDFFSQAQKDQVQEALEKEQKLLDQLKNLLDKTPNGDLNQDTKDELSQIFASSGLGWPNPNPPFPQLSQQELQNEVYLNDLKTLQQYLSAVRSRYAIT